jgi:hypothetical protein
MKFTPDHDNHRSVPQSIFHDGYQNKDTKRHQRRTAGQVQGRGMPIPSYMGLQILSTFQTDCGDCVPLSWTSPATNVRANPSENTAAVVIDVRGGQGAIHTMNTEDNKHVDKVGPVKEGGNLVMVPWKSIWWYYAIGSVHVAHIEKKS